jgi:hypothetical protein
VAPDLVVLWIGSVLCVAAVLCAIVFALRRRRGALRTCGVTVTALSALIIADVVVAGARSEKPAMVTAQSTHPAPAGTSAPAATPAPTPSPTPTPAPAASPTAKPTPEPKATAAPSAVPTTHPEVLQDFSIAWGEIVRISVSALKAHDSAGEYLRKENIPQASRELKTCQDRASGIVTHTFNLRLDPQNGSDRDLLIAINKVGDGLENVCKSARSYLETKAPSDFADAKVHFANVVDGIVQAESLARSKYQRLGGNPETLASFKTALR